MSSSGLILKAHDRILPLEKFNKDSQQKWQGPFFFICAADTQLGLMDRWGTDGSDGKDYPEASWAREIELCKKSVELINKMRPKPRFFIVCGDQFRDQQAGLKLPQNKPS